MKLSVISLFFALTVACGSSYADVYLTSQVNTDQFAIAGWDSSGDVMVGPVSYNGTDHESVSGTMYVCAAVCGLGVQPCIKQKPCCPQAIPVSGTEYITAWGDQNSITCQIQHKK